MSWFPQGRFGPCMCGATDCRSCGPAQGYTLDENEEDFEDSEFELPTDVEMDAAIDAALKDAP